VMEKTPVVLSDSFPHKRKKRRHRHRREITIPLANDSEFFTLLTSAITSLSEFELEQKTTFAKQVKTLADHVSQVASPLVSKTDMYAWREIFSLWIEAQIFESERERDRGERSIQDAESRLQWFVEQVGRNKLVVKMKQKKSRAGMEQFVQLNETLLDLKRFANANEEAARKILKKHDKRTALTASSDYPAFMQSIYPPSSETDSVRHLILPGLPSLPHILLSLFTTTLIPILPSIDDFSCLICSDVAYMPIRLDCGHHFCLRCLVKMQKRAQDACPACRSAVVMKANAKNLDVALRQFLELYFPKEVKLKAKSNKRESEEEELMAMGLNPNARCCIS